MTDGYIRWVYVPIEAFYDYVKSGLLPEYAFRSVVSNRRAKHNYKKFAKRMKKAIKHLPPELEVEIRVTRGE